MSLPFFTYTDNDNTNYEPIYNYPLFENCFEIRSSDLPINIIENIFSYDIDIINKTISLEVYLNQSLLKELDSIEVYKMEVIHHSKEGEIKLKRIMNDLTYLGYSTKGKHESDNILNVTVVWSFEEIFNKHS